MITSILVCFIIFLTFVSADITSERLDIQEKILNSYMNQPAKELFKVYHFIFNKGYSLNNEEAIRRYKIFKNNLDFIKTHNSKGLTWTLGLNDFADMTNDEYMAFNNMKAPDEKISSNLKNEKFLDEANNILDYFDEIADKIDNDRNSENENDDDIPFPSTLENITHIRNLSPVKNQAKCGSCWAFSAVTTIESAWNVKYNTNSTNFTLTQSIAPQQLVDCDKNSKGCNGGWMPHAYNYISKTSAKLITWEKNYPYTARNGTCRDENITEGIKVVGQEGCSPWFNTYGYKKCTKDSFWTFLNKSPIGVTIDTKHPGFRFYKRGIIDLSAYQNTTTPYNCDRLTHAIVAYAWTTTTENNTNPGLTEYISLRNSWGNRWGDKGDFHIYYTPLFNDTCWVTKVATRPLIE